MSFEDQDSLRPISKQTLSQSVAEQLRTAIRTGSMLPGERLIERDISESLGVSRIPVREAIYQLVDEGLVREIPHGGAFVYASTPG